MPRLRTWGRLATTTLRAPGGSSPSPSSSSPRTTAQELPELPPGTSPPPPPPPPTAKRPPSVQIPRTDNDRVHKEWWGHRRPGFADLFEAITTTPAPSFAEVLKPTTTAAYRQTSSGGGGGDSGRRTPPPTTTAAPDPPPRTTTTTSSPDAPLSPADFAKMLNPNPVAAGTPDFLPRTEFATSHSLPKTYFLGHHAKTLRQIRDSLSLVHLIIECRDARLPLTTWNPELEAAAAGRSRIVVYTKADLLAPDATRRGPRLRAYEPVLESAAATPGSGLLHEGTVLMYPGDLVAGRRLLKLVARVAREKDILTGLCAMVVGMPNVGKSTLLNLLRAEGMKDLLKDKDGNQTRKRLPKVAKTGQQPGITRSVGTGVRVLDMDPPVYVKDTPGVFVPYMPNAESMIKLALVAGIKANLVPDGVLADYLLYRLNLVTPKLYARFCPTPTNDVLEWLNAVARSAHMLRPGGGLDLERAATFMIHRFRDGRLGQFPLDDLSQTGLDQKLVTVANPPVSMHQARKQAKVVRKLASKQRYMARTGGSDQ